MGEAETQGRSVTARSRTIWPLFPLVTGLDTAQEAAGWSSGLKAKELRCLTTDKRRGLKNYKNCRNNFKHG